MTTHTLDVNSLADISLAEVLSATHLPLDLGTVYEIAQSLRDGLDTYIDGQKAHGAINIENLAFDTVGILKPGKFNQFIGGDREQYFKSASLPFLSPEQLRDEKSTPATDAYAVAVVLFYLLSGQFPQPNTSYEARTQAAKSGSEPLRALSSVRPDLSYLDVTFRSALAFEPKSRETVDGLLNALNPVKAPKPVLTTQPPIATNRKNQGEKEKPQPTKIATAKVATAKIETPHSDQITPTVDTEKTKGPKTVFSNPTPKQEGPQVSSKSSNKWLPLGIAAVLILGFGFWVGRARVGTESKTDQSYLKQLKMWVALQQIPPDMEEIWPGPDSVQSIKNIPLNTDEEKALMAFLQKEQNSGITVKQRISVSDYMKVLRLGLNVVLTQSKLRQDVIEKEVKQAQDSLIAGRKQMTAAQKQMKVAQLQMNQNAAHLTAEARRTRATAMAAAGRAQAAASKASGAANRASNEVRTTRKYLQDKEAEIKNGLRPSPVF